MIHTSNVTEQVEGVCRQQTLAVLEDLMVNAEEFELGDPPHALERYRQKLRENTYKVLVVGEAKRGKSTFVNALIGRDILPTDVDVATSQVFNVRPSETEAYRVRYEDGSAQEISPEDLPLYGSQAGMDAGYLPAPSQIIRWIEMDVPIRFLPEGVSILDTPGLGSLYAGHAQITYRFVPEADAVIFVLESGKPVVDDDVKFIKEILAVTRNIFFIQTKIDRYTKEDWQNVQRRSQEILGKQFKGKLTDTRVWPISSTNLRKAATADEKTERGYLIVSRYKELESALKAFLARVSGWGRNAEALAVAAKYHATSRNTLAGRLTALTAESNQKQAELQKTAMEAKQRFDAEWGVYGEKYQELRGSLQRVMAVGKQSFSNTMQPGSDIELAQKAKIDKVSSLKMATRVAEEMPGELITAAIHSWAQICEEVQQRCAALLGPFAEAIDNMAAPIDPDLPGFLAGDTQHRFEHDYFGMFRSAAGGGMLVLGASSMGSMAGVVIPALAAVTAVAPYVVIAALPVLIGGGIKGAFSSEVKIAQQQLRVQLAEQLQKVRRYFFDVDLGAESFSRVDEYFMALDRTVNERVQELVNKKSRESEAEIARLTQARQLGEREREAHIKQTQEQLAKWDDLGRSIGAVTAQIQSAVNTSGAGNYVSPSTGG